MKPVLKRTAATYERTSSEDQKERGTIETQTAEIARQLGEDSDIELFARFIDDGVSGTIPLIDRPAGRRLMRAAEAHEFNELWIYNIKRLGRDAVDLLWVRRRFESLGVRVISVLEGEPDLLGFDIHAVVGDNDRRGFLKHTAAGMDRAAREGRYTGGVISYGYKVEERDRRYYPVEDDGIVWGDLSAADVVRMVFRMSGIERKTSRQIADQLNAMAVPTAYAKNSRGIRGKRTQEVWRPDRVSQLLRNVAYRGELLYGRRSPKEDREVIAAACPRIVPDDLWVAAQATLEANRFTPRNTRKRYLLRSVIRCGICNYSFVGSAGEKGAAWYRCNGYLTHRTGKNRCQARAIRNTAIEPVVWADIEMILRNPGEALQELTQGVSSDIDQEQAVSEAQRLTFEAALADLEPRRQRNLDLYERGRISSAELDQRLDQIESERRAIGSALADLPLASTQEEPIGPDLLNEIAARLEQGFSDEQRQEIVQLLVRQITVYTTVLDNGTKEARLVIEYRFSSPDCSQTHNGTGSSPPAA